MNPTLLIELLTEELPPKSLAKLAVAFRDGLQKSLAEAGYIAADNEGQWFATPRRLVARFENCHDTQPDRVIEKKGPAVSSGVDAAGKPTKALEGFMRSTGVEFAQLEKLSDGKTDYFVARQQKAGERIDAHLAGFVEAALKKLPVAKLMRWGAGEAQFVRPVHGLILLHGARVVPGRVMGLDSRNVTLGHRFMSSGLITIADADQYFDTLENQGKVIVCFTRRRAMIREQLDAAATKRGLQWLQDDALVDEVTALVEHPTVYEAEFEEEFLAVPPECLILTMKANQKYFPLMDNAGGKHELTNKFLVVSNMQVADPVHIVTGNARVVRPRLSDAKFFFETDKKTPLSKRVEKLERVVYHNKLGTQGQRVQRLVVLAGKIAGHLGADKAAAERAALLAKADLVSDMVGEFPELQGIMGRYYALSDGESAVVADAIEAHYHPRFNGDSLPQGNVACAVALAERLDALTGFFGIGQIPTGDKDPFGLRRAALGVLRMLMETPLPLDIEHLLDEAAAGFAPGLLTVPVADRRTASADFLRERLRHLLREQGHEQNLVDAVLALEPTRIDLVPAKLAAVKAFALLPEAEALAAANKRIVNLLKKAEGKTGDIDVMLLQELAEKALFSRLNSTSPEVESRLAAGDYEGALKALAGLRRDVDAFFDGVMVMADEPLTRANRLALLAKLSNLMNQVADISRL
ncbi:MAG: glycine--tRNA ligase subunit beta [Rhodocyclaceae bacterium]|nr:glycine--tRNA ligase subunit beta [Rhodocyclaceae bacterium]